MNDWTGFVPATMNVPGPGAREPGIYGGLWKL